MRQKEIDLQKEIVRHIETDKETEIGKYSELE